MMPRTLTLALLVVTVSCESVTEPTAVTPSARALVHNGTPYPQVDAQLARLYAFNNCLTGLWPAYTANPRCPAVDMTYDMGSLSNLYLASVFPQGFVVDANASHTLLGDYLAAIGAAYQLGRVSCRAQFALRKIGSAIDTVLLDIAGGRSPDLSKLPQPLSADIMELNPFAGANDNGTPCAPATPPAPITPAGGYSLFVINQSCSDNGRSIEISQDTLFTSQSVHSNASIRVSGSGNGLSGNTTYRCQQTVAAGNDFVNGPTLVAAVRLAPITYGPADFPCTYSRTGNFNVSGNGPWWVGGSSASRQLNPGTYCATGNITLSTMLVKGTVTFVAGGTITVSGALANLRSYAHDVVLYARSNSNNAVRVTGTYTTLAGHIYAPSGRASINGNNASLNGSIVANKILIAGNNISIVAAGPAN